MDENSREGETSESAENVLDKQRVKDTDEVSHLKNVGIKIDLEGRKTLDQVSERVESSTDASVSGPSTDYSDVKAEGKIVLFEKEISPEPDDKPAAEETITEPVEEPVAESQPLIERVENVSTISESVSTTIESPVTQPRVHLAPAAEEYEEARTITIGPPPSYSFVMKQKKKSSKPKLSDPVVPNRPPPPTYSGNRGLCLPPEESRFERINNLPSLSAPLWRSHSQPALCPRCGIIILTTIHSHDSVATHVTALALCLFGCWPCCLLPYCLNVCKNTYHHCPICQSFLGAYSPW